MSKHLEEDGHDATPSATPDMSLDRSDQTVAKKGHLNFVYLKVPPKGPRAFHSTDHHHLSITSLDYSSFQN